MSADATSPDAPLPSREEQLVDRAEAAAGRAIGMVRRGAWDVWNAGRFLLFAFYLLLGILCIWLGAIERVFGLFRFVLRSMMIVLLWLWGGGAPGPGPPATSIAGAISRDLKYF